MNAPSVNLNCPKCASGRDTTFTRYVSVNDYLMCTCTICGYEWRLDPADRPINPPIPDADSDVQE
jgi:DNA-directed RNA polymerase subunit M/transcription elongation factor TFIIS